MLSPMEGGPNDNHHTNNVLLLFSALQVTGNRVLPRLVSLFATRVLACIVYQASPRDPFVLTGVVVAMAMLGLLATRAVGQSSDPAARRLRQRGSEARDFPSASLDE